MLPEKFLQRMAIQLKNELPAFQEALKQAAPVSIRLNPKKTNKTWLLEAVPWCDKAYYLPQRPTFIFDPLWHAGAYYVQEAASMLLAHVFKQLFPLPHKLNVLDLCAAPGGKSTLLSAILSENCLLVANEVIASRNSLLRENLIRWGSANVAITQNDPKDFHKLPHFFDCIVVDAPCSGEGLFRKEPEAVYEWNDTNLQLCVARQQRIVHDVLPALKPGGYLIYSTCTYNPDENEKQIAFFEKQYHLKNTAIHFEKHWGITEYNYSGLQCFPHKVKGEGFFIAVMQKNAENNITTIKPKNKLPLLNKEKIEVLRNLLIDAEKHEWISFQDKLHAFPKEKIVELNMLLQLSHVRMFGIPVAQIKHKEIIPQPELAFAQVFNKENYPCFSLQHETALKFLRKESFDIETSHEGWAIVAFHNIPLGFVKINKQRINNYYPTHWRLRKEFHPSELWSLLSYENK